MRRLTLLFIVLVLDCAPERTSYSYCMDQCNTSRLQLVSIEVHSRGNWVCHCKAREEYDNISSFNGLRLRSGEAFEFQPGCFILKQVDTEDTRGTFKVMCNNPDGGMR